jgi:hypothetical protein
MERRHQLGLDSYDRFFPNQDTMPKGGFGNLIAFPLQKIPRESGFTEFLDDEMRPYPDQWSFLASIPRRTQSAAERLISEALQHGDLIGVRIASVDDEDRPDPWTLPPSRKQPDKPIKSPLPATVEVVRSNLVFVEKKGLPPEMLNRLLRIAAFQNPEFIRRKPCGFRLLTSLALSRRGLRRRAARYALLAMPTSWKGTLQQYVGRLHRLHDSKRVVEVYDYVDPNVRMLARMYDRRLKGSCDMGYEVTAFTDQQRLDM